MRSNLRTLAKPYLLWLTIQMFMLGLASGQTNGSYSFGLADYLLILWKPGGQFWYLYALLIMHVAAALLLPRFGTVALWAVALAAYGFSERGAPGPFPGVVEFSIFYAMGVMFFQLTREIHVERANQWLGALLSGVGFAASVGWSLHREVGYWTIESLPVAVFGAVFTLHLGALARGAAGDVLAYLGRQSMPIFLLHVMFCAGTRMALQKYLGFTNPGAILLVVSAAGLLGPLACKLAAERLGMSELVGFGPGPKPSRPVIPVESRPAAPAAARD